MGSGGPLYNCCQDEALEAEQTDDLLDNLHCVRDFCLLPRDNFRHGFW